jgi:transposase
MAIKSPNRYQTTFLPKAVEEYVTKDDPVRAYDAIIDALDYKELGLFKQWKKVGNSPYDPISMLKLLTFGYSYGWKSSRKLERATHHNLAFIWLVGELKPDHKTIAEFRRKNKECLKKALKETARICMKLDLIAGNCLFLDGSKIRGNSSINQTKRIETWEEKLADIDKRIEQILEEAEKIDRAESENPSLVKMNEEFQDAKTLKEKIESVIEKGKSKNLKKVNGTDPDAVDFSSRQGSHSGYNVQVVTDEKNGLIVNVDVVNENNDYNQFAKQINQANENLDKNCETAVADAGYSVVDDLKEITDKEIDVIVPSQKQASKTEKNPFDKDEFQYNPTSNEYKCPEGKTLRFSYYSKVKNHFIYRMKREADCRECCHYGICTKAKRGRTIARLKNEEVKHKLEARYASDEGQRIYKKRKEKVELQFGHIKRNLGGGAFLQRGIEAVRAEFSIYANCFNIARMITLLGGTTEMIKVLKIMK